MQHSPLGLSGPILECSRKPDEVAQVFARLKCALLSASSPTAKLCHLQDPQANESEEVPKEMKILKDQN